jgi:hypothetical protein
LGGNWYNTPNWKRKNQKYLFGLKCVDENATTKRCWIFINVLHAKQELTLFLSKFTFLHNAILNQRFLAAPVNANEIDLNEIRRFDSTQRVGC